MIVLRTILLSLEAIISILLIGIILIQKAKGGGLGLAFGGGGESLFGSRAGNVLTKGTIILAIAFMVNTVALAIIYARSHDRTLMDDHMRAAPTAAQPTAQPTPAEMPTPAAPGVEMPAETTVEVPAAPATEVPPADATPTPTVEIPLEPDTDVQMAPPVIEQDIDIGSPTPTPSVEVERPVVEE